MSIAHELYLTRTRREQQWLNVYTEILGRHQNPRPEDGEKIADAIDGLRLSDADVNHDIGVLKDFAFHLQIVRELRSRLDRATRTAAENQEAHQRLLESKKARMATYRRAEEPPHPDVIHNELEWGHDREIARANAAALRAAEQVREIEVEIEKAREPLKQLFHTNPRIATLLTE